MLTWDYWRKTGQSEHTLFNVKIPAVNQRTRGVKLSCRKSCKGDDANFEAIDLDLGDA